MFIQIGLNARALLGPADPEHSSRSQLFAEALEFLDQSRFRLGKNVREVERKLIVAGELAPVQRHFQFRSHFRRHLYHRHAKAVFDPEFLRKRSTGVSRHIALGIRVMVYWADGAYQPRRERTRRFFRSLATISMVR